MGSLSRRNSNSHRDASAWPGWVDALSSLVMVVIFLLMIFVVAQFYLASALTGRDQQLGSLNRKVAELNELLALERDANADLRVGITQLSTELQASVATRDDMTEQLGTLQDQQEQATRTLDERRHEAASLQQDIQQLREVRRRLEGELAEAHTTLRMTEEQRQTLLAQLGTERDRSKKLEGELAGANEKTMLAQREIEQRDIRVADLQKELAGANEKTTLAQREIEQRDVRLGDLQQALTGEEAQSQEARRQVELLNQQIAALRQQLAQIGAVLDASEEKAREQQVQIADLGTRLNQALASKVQELARYRSEFFGRVREVLGERPDISIVGDRFVFQSELLFPSGSAMLGGGGQTQLVELARTLIDVGKRIPPDINWVLRVDGHTDIRPINRNLFPSNWELSSARAISVVKYLADQGIPAERLAAAGFGEFQPLDRGTSEEALARNRRIELKLDQR